MTNESSSIKCEVIKTRYSCRAFDENEKIDENEILCLIAAASLAPSSFNEQPWRFRIINDSLSIKSIVHNENLWVSRAACVIAVYVKDASQSSKAILAIGAAIENMLLEATSRSIGSCWINAEKEDVETIGDNTFRLISYVVLGKERYKLNRTSRLDIEQIII